MYVTYHLVMSNGLATVAGGLVGLAAMGALAAARAAAGPAVPRRRPSRRGRRPRRPVAAASAPASRASRSPSASTDDTRPPVLRLDCVMPAGEPAPTFEAAVLEPLAALVDESPLGRVHPRRAEPFLLLVHADPGVAAPRPGVGHRTGAASAARRAAAAGGPPGVRGPRPPAAPPGRDAHDIPRRPGRAAARSRWC